MIKFELNEDGTSESSRLSNLNELNASLSELDARALILTIAAFAEDTLGDLLIAFMFPHDASQQLLSGFSAPLGTFSARIKAAYALGLITKDQFSDLEHLRKIRNAFSHTWRPITLENPSIAGHIKGICFSSLDDTYPASPLIKLRTCLSTLLVELQVTINRISKESRTARLIGSRLITGIAGENTPEQIDAARTALQNLEDNLLTAKGEELLFYISRLTEWTHRLGVILRQPSKKAHHEEVNGLIHGLQRRIAELTA